MGFWDKLFGRGKDVAEDVGQKTDQYGDKAMDVAKDAGTETKEFGEQAVDKGGEAFDTAKDKVTGGGGGGGGQTPQQ